ncbi:MAG: hypothetical protein E7369_00420 [Clostridiales bacterium]|nr:hypothetical protein [Clostridiales bacterium]
MGLFDFFKKGLTAKRAATLLDDMMQYNFEEGRLRGEGVSSCGILVDKQKKVNRQYGEVRLTIKTDGITFEFFTQYNDKLKTFYATVSVKPFNKFQYEKFLKPLKEKYKNFYIDGGHISQTEDYYFFISYGAYEAKTENEFYEQVHNFRKIWQDYRLQQDLLEIAHSAGFCKI